jgi:hypothetical protein
MIKSSLISIKIKTVAKLMGYLHSEGVEAFYLTN